MVENLERVPARLVPPGEILEDELKARELTPGAFSHMAGLAEGEVVAIISGNLAIDIRRARHIAQALGTSPDFWLNLQTNYRSWLDQKIILAKEQVIFSELNSLYRETRYVLDRALSLIQDYGKATTKVAAAIQEAVYWGALNLPPEQAKELINIFKKHTNKEEGENDAAAVGVQDGDDLPGPAQGPEPA